MDLVLIQGPERPREAYQQMKLGELHLAFSIVALARPN